MNVVVVFAPKKIKIKKIEFRLVESLSYAIYPLKETKLFSTEKI